MGGEIVYCEACKNRLGAADFQKKHAIRVGAKSYCRQCAPMDALLDDELANEPTPVPTRRSTQTIKKVAPPRPGYEGTRRLPRAEMDRRAGGGGKGLIVGISIAAVVLVVIVVAVMSGGGKPPPSTPATTTASTPAVAPAPAAAPAAAPAVAPPVVAPPPASSKEDAAKEAVKKAREYVAARPQDLSGQLELWRKAVAAAEGLPMAVDLKRTVELVQQQLRDQIRNDLQPVDEDSLAARFKEEFGRALKVLEEARGRHSAEEWTSAIEKRVRETKAQAAQLFATVKQEALDFRKRGLPERVKGISDRLARWGMPDYVAEFQRDVGGAAATTAPPAVPATPATPPAASGPAPATPPPVAPAASDKPTEAQLYQQQWQEALALAASRDYAAAVSRLDKALEAVQDKVLLKEAAGDAELLRQVRAVHTEALTALSKLAKGQKLAVDYADAEGKKARVEGTVARVSASWIEIKKDKGSVFVDFAEMAPASLLEPAKAKADPASMALLALLEREEALAKSLAGAAAGRIPEKYWKHAASPAAAAAPKEAEARALFHAAWSLERDWPEGTRKGGLTPKYRKLLAEYAETSVARRHRDLLQRLVGPARETLFFADDILGSGTFTRTSQDKVGSYWTVTAEPLQSKALENFVQFEFPVGPEPAPPKCWIYAGGCCVDALDLYWQGTDLADEKTGRKIEPGESAAVPLKAVIAGLPKAHGGHPAGAPPAKWGWIPVPLPKLAGEGTKKVRLLSERPGFAVAYAVVSSARGSPPKDSDLRALDRTESEALATLAAGLVGHWKFDDGQGAAAADSVAKGKGGTLEKGPAWAIGRLGGAIAFDGKDDFVKIPHAESLDPAQLTVAAWFNTPKVGAGGKDRDWLVGKADNEHKNGHYALVLHNTNAPIAYLNMGDGAANCVEVRGAANSFAPGAWHHIALTYDTKDLRLYLNGQEAGMKEVNKQRTMTTTDIIIGKRGDDFSKYKGLIDDVRIYNRVLAPPEIQALARGQAK